MRLPRVAYSLLIGLPATLPVVSAPTASLAQSNLTSANAAQVQAGEYLARAGDCIACHTAPTGHLFAGGLAMPTPFGTIYSTNITPDPETGIGNWNVDEFYQVMHDGRSRDSGLLYPAMPFASYTKVTRADSDAIFAYLKTIPAVRQANRHNDLRFPYNNRDLIIGWRTLFFTQGEYQPDPHQSAEWNRGAYLVEGLGHCEMCHTPINRLGGSSERKKFQGGLIPMQNWYAPSLTSNQEAGLGDWSVDDIIDYLKTGKSKRGIVYGPMAEVVYNSLQYLSDADTRAMAVYLKSLGQGTPPPPAKTTAAKAESSLLLTLGDTVYEAHCASCHGAEGRGAPPDYPPLAQNQSIEMASAVNAIRMVLNGGYPPGTNGNPRPYGMPPFAQTLSDDEVAAVVSYIRTAWGNSGAAVTAAQANELRSVPLD